MRLIITFFILFFCSFSFLKSQESFYRFSLDPGVVYSYQVKPLEVPSVLDKYSNGIKHSFGLTLGVNVQLTKNWGVNFKINAISGRYKEEESFEQTFKESFLPNYFVSKPSVTNSATKNEEIQSFTVGVFYKIPDGRWKYQFGLDLGVSNYNIPDLHYTLKENGTNLYYKAKFETKTKDNVVAYFLPNASVGFNMTERLNLFVEASYGMLIVPYSFSHETTNLYTNEVTEDIFDNRQLVQLPSVRLGLCVGLGRKIIK